MSKPYIRLYNVFTDNCEIKLNSRQLYFYSLAASMKSLFMGYTLTTLNLICHRQIVFYGDNEHRNVQNCKDVIISLVDKNVIHIESESNIKANTPMKINFPEFKKGFEDINYQLWEMVSSPDELMVFNMLKRISGFEKSKEQWSKLLGYSSKNTGYDVVTEMESDGKIYSVEGSLYTDAEGRIKQNPTKWYLGKKPEKKEAIKDIVGDESISVPDGSGIRWGNWKGSNNLTKDDYILFAEQEDNVEFMKVAEAKINRITKNGTNDKAAFAIDKEIEKGKSEKFYIEKEKLREVSKKNKDLILGKYGICLELKDGSFMSHKDEFDWSKVMNFHYIDERGGCPFSSVKGKYPIYEAVLQKYDHISYKTLIAEISPYIRGEKKIVGVEEIVDEDDYDDLNKYRY